ncbi:MAG: IS3 family transposase [Candidatus Baltobacteraceae bacterium]
MRCSAIASKRCTANRVQHTGDRGCRPSLQDEGVRVSDKRIARVMRERKIVGATRRKGFKATIRDRDARPAPTSSVATSRRRRPIGSGSRISRYVPAWSGFLFLAVVLDVYSRRVVGWAMANHLRTELVLDALNMALYRRKPSGVIHHSDQGCQYTSIAFEKRYKEAGVQPSMGPVGDCYDNAMCESFNATLGCELLVQHRFKNQREASLAAFDFIEGWYNRRRRHTAIGNISPMEFERRMSQPA